MLFKAYFVAATFLSASISESATGQYANTSMNPNGIIEQTPPTTTPKISIEENKCHGDWPCKWRCNRQISHVWFCQCDNLCWLYGDCCEDYYDSCLGVSINQTDDSILAAILSTLPTYYDLLQFYEAVRWRSLSTCQQVNGKYFQVVRTCGKEPQVMSTSKKLFHSLDRGDTSESIPASTAVDNCEKDFGADFLPTLPVSLNDGYVVHFYNIYCATCNGVDPSKLQVWNVTNMNDTSLNGGSIKIRLTTSLGWRTCLPDFNAQLLSPMIEPVKKSTIKTNFPPMMTPLGSDKVTKAINYELCRIGDPLRLRLCLRFQYLLFTGTFVIKNRHCSVCSDGQIESCATHQCMCFPSLIDTYVAEKQACMNDDVPCLSVSIPPSNLPDFKRLFNFRASIGETAITHSEISFFGISCPDGQVFAPFYEKCVYVVCPISTVMGSEKCRGEISCKYDGTCDSLTHNEFEESAPLADSLRSLSVYLELRNITTDKKDMNNVRLIEPDKINVSLNYMKWVWMKQRSARDNQKSLSVLSIVKSIAEKAFHTKVDNYSIEMTHSCMKPGTEIPGYRNESTAELCTTFTFQFNNTSSINSIILTMLEDVLTKTLVSALKANVAVTKIRISNVLSDGITAPADKLLETGICPSGRRVTTRMANMYFNNNGNHMINLSGNVSFRISLFGFTLSAIVDETTQEVRLADTAEIFLCVPNVTFSNCSIIFYNSSYITLYNNQLIVTRHLQLWWSFLNSSKVTTDVRLSDALKMFRDLYNIRDVELYQQDSFIVSPHGAFVCSDFSSSYNWTNVTSVTVYYKFLPTSVEEEIATMISLTISITSLVIVLVIYGFLPELRNVPGKMVMSMSASLLLAQLLFLFSTHPQGLLCEIYAAAQYALWLSTFAWLTVMVGHLAYVLYSQSKSVSISKFYVFSLLSWGIPFLMAAVSFTLDKVGLVPMEFGSDNICWFGNFKAMALAFGVPVFLLISVSFTCGIFVIRAILKSSKFVSKAAHDQGRVRRQLLLCINLSLLTGLTWVFYIAAVLADVTAVWVMFILTNGTQGLFVFACYAARRSVIRRLDLRCGPRGRRYRDSNSSKLESTTRVTSSK